MFSVIEALVFCVCGKYPPLQRRQQKLKKMKKADNFGSVTTWRPIRLALISHPYITNKSKKKGLFLFMKEVKDFLDTMRKTMSETVGRGNASFSSILISSRSQMLHKSQKTNCVVSHSSLLVGRICFWVIT